jgi:hypothetical protein
MVNSTRKLKDWTHGSSARMLVQLHEALGSNPNTTKKTPSYNLNIKVIYGFYFQRFISNNFIMCF